MLPVVQLPNDVRYISLIWLVSIAFLSLNVLLAFPAPPSRFSTPAETFFNDDNGDERPGKKHRQQPHDYHHQDHLHPPRQPQHHFQHKRPFTGLSFLDDDDNDEGEGEGEDEEEKEGGRKEKGEEVVVATGKASGRSSSVREPAQQMQPHQQQQRQQVSSAVGLQTVELISQHTDMALHTATASGTATLKAAAAAAGSGSGSPAGHGNRRVNAASNGSSSFCVGGSFAQPESAREVSCARQRMR